MTNDVIDLTGSALAIDNYVKLAYLNADGELVLEMMDGTLHSVDLTYIPGGDSADNYVVAGQLLHSTPEFKTQTLRLTMKDDSTVDIDLTGLWEKGGVRWDGGMSYVPGDMVTEGDKSYIAIASSIAKSPALSPDYWVPTTDAYDERGGVLYDEDYEYLAGDIVTYNGAVYTCRNVTTGVFNPGDWSLVSGGSGGGIERGGIAWDSTTSYLVDDIVAVGQVIYICNTANSGENPTSSSKWDNLSLAEKGGLAYNSTLTYNAGDMVSESGIVYIATTSVPTGTPPPNVSYWTTASVNELGGREYNGGNTYSVGDIVSYAGEVYRCVNSTTGAFVPSDWVDVEEEMGGQEWSNTKSYSIGDVVTSNHVLPAKAYVSLVNGNEGNNPINQPSMEWQEFDSKFYNVGTHHPTDASDEYPQYAGETEGAVWYISGLGIDMMTGDPVTYTYTAGDLVGIDVVDGDRIIWISTDGTTGEPQWLWIPIPRISAERGGVEWMSKCVYEPGDVVSYNEELYLALTEHSQSQPDINPTDWKKARERGGVAWNSTSEYMKGDIVVDLANFVTYKSNINNNIGNQPSTPSSGWDRVVDEEKGGILWDSTLNYEIGDVVTKASLIYIALTDNTNKDPETNPSDWVSVSEIVVEHGGVEWSASIEYVKNDTVYYDDKTYVSLSDGNINKQPDINRDYWDVTDRGGISYDPYTTYEMGDIVCDSTVVPMKAYTSIVDDNKGNDLYNTSYWQEFDSMFYNAGSYDPSDTTDPDNPFHGSEYPDTTNENEGAIWYVTGQGQAPDGSPAKFTFTTGPLIGIEVVDNDRIIMVDRKEDTMEPIWLWSPFPRYKREQGGKVWQQGYIYDHGDVVTYDEISYISRSNNNTGNTPSSSPVDWKRSGGSGLFDSTLPYQEGDMVVVGDDIYIAPPGGVVEGPFDPSDWYAATKEGDLWVDNVNYTIGDIVSYNSIAYVALTDNIGKQPNSNASDWAASESGGVVWKSGIDYKAGTIVTEAGIGYMAITDHASVTANAPSNGTADWTDAYIVSNVDPGTY